MARWDRPVAEEDERCLGVGWQWNWLRALDRRQDESVHWGEGDVQEVLSARHALGGVGEHGRANVFTRRQRRTFTAAGGADGAGAGGSGRPGGSGAGGSSGAGPLRR